MPKSTTRRDPCGGSKTCGARSPRTRRRSSFRSSNAIAHEDRQVAQRLRRVAQRRDRAQRRLDELLAQLARTFDAGQFHEGEALLVLADVLPQNFGGGCDVEDV